MKHTNLSRVIAAAIACCGMITPSFLSAEDLPYTSGSTGADGAFNVPSNFPNTGPRGGMVYHEAEHAVYYISSYFVWKSTDGANWEKLPDIPNQWSVDPASGQLCYDSTNGVLYAFALRADTTSAQLYKWEGGEWQTAGDPMPAYDGYHGNWCYGRMVYHAKNQTMLLFGVGPSRNETWSFDGTSWTQQSPTNVPVGRNNCQMAYDPIREETLMYAGDGYSDTWVWNGSDWISKTPVSNPPDNTGSYGVTWHPGYQGVVIPVSTRELWVWNGVTWRKEATTGLISEGLQNFSVAYHAASAKMIAVSSGSQVKSLKDQSWSFDAGNPYYVDLNKRASGIYHFTDITVPTGITVKFHRNVTNTPVMWLATGDVKIDGTVDVSANHYISGPGGYDGANGPMNYGYGPGGGYPTDQLGGRYYGVYGNPQIEPLIGGSGGGSGGDDYTYPGPGGGGGGALLIASSKDIQLNGTISANGGYSFFYTSGGYAHGYGSGSGSGGAIKLVADRVQGNGALAANAGYAHSNYSNQTGSPGRIRIESYDVSEIGTRCSPAAWWASSPVWTSASIIDGDQLQYELKVTHVDGTAVRQPPTGSTSTPDVYFSTDQPVAVVVSGRNIPDGTQVKLRVGGSGINVTLPAEGNPPVTMQAGGATFNVTIPAGSGGIQAIAAFQKPAATP